MTSSRTRAALAAALLAVFTLLVGGLVSPATAATTTGKLKGVVTVDGKPVGFAKVQVYRLLYRATNGEYEVAATRLKTDNTDSKGRYSFSGLSAKSATTSRYVVLVTDRTGRTVKTYRTVVVRKARTTTQNVPVRAAAVLRGSVNAAGRSPAGLTVGVDVGSYNDQGPSYEKLYPEWSTTVKADGTFTLSGLPATSYDSVRVSDGPYAQQCFDLVAATLADCATVPFERSRLQAAAGERTLPTVTATKFAPPVTKLAGKVTDTSGKALKGITVRLTSGQASATAVTRSSGRYTINESIPGGAYTVRFDDPKLIWASQYLGGGPDKSVRQQVVVTPGQAVSGLDTALKSISTAKIATKSGVGSAKVAFRIKRKASGSAPGGTLTLSFEGVSKTVSVTKGRATVTLNGIRRGTRSLVASYSGTSSTAGFSKIVKVNVQ